MLVSILLTSGLVYVKEVILPQCRTDVNINSRDTYGRTPLLTASRSNQLEIVKILLPRDDLDLAAYNDYDIDGVLFVHGGGGTVLHYA